MLKEKHQYFWVIVSLIFISNSLSILESYSEVIISGFSLFLSVWLFIIQKKKIDRFFIAISLIWLTINSLSYIFFDSYMNIITVLGYLVRIYFVYLLLKLVGVSFFDKLERITFILAAISIPLFILQQIMPNVFASLSPLFKNITMNEQASNGGWYSFIYMYSGWAQDRNCGFMWEPGGYAMILTWALIHNLFRKNFKLERKSLIYTIAIITTLSTSGYLALMLIIFMVLLNKFKGKAKIIGVTVFFIAGLLSYKPILELDFMGDKIDKYVENSDQLLSKDVSEWKHTKAGRLTMIYLVMENILINPLGYGNTYAKSMINSKGELVGGANAVMETIYRWGIAGTIFLFLMIYRYLRYISIKKNQAYIIGVMALVIVFSSNPVSRNILFIGILFYPLLFKHYFIQKTIHYYPPIDLLNKKTAI